MKIWDERVIDQISKMSHSPAKDLSWFSPKPQGHANLRSICPIFMPNIVFMNIQNNI